MPTRLSRTTALSGSVLLVATMLGGCGGGSDDPELAAPSGLSAASRTSLAPTSSAPDTSSAATSSTAGSAPASSAAEPSSTAPPVVIPYAGGESIGVELHQPADVSKLRGAPESFRTFMAGVVTKVRAEATCTSPDVGVVVEAVRTDGYASGAIAECGGYQALWATVGGQWKEIAGTQDIWECAVLQRYQVPSDISGEKCYDPQAKKLRDYQHA